VGLLSHNFSYPFHEPNHTPSYVVLPQASWRDPGFLHKFVPLVDTFHAFGNGTHQGHSNCSPAAEVSSYMHQRKLNHSWNESSNRSTANFSKLAGTSKNQPTMMDALRKMFKDKNCHEKAKLQYQLACASKTLQTPYRKAWLCDGTFIAAQAERTFYHRPHLQENSSLTRQINPCALHNRRMLPQQAHRDTLRTWITVSQTATEYMPVTWNKQCADLWAWIKGDRPALMWVLMLEQGQNDGGWQECEESPQEETQVRLCASVIALQPLFQHWTCRNHETAVLSGPATRALKVILHSTSVSSEAVSNLTKSSSAPFSYLFDYAMRLEPQPGQGSGIVCAKARELFELMVSLVDADLQLRIESVCTSHSDLHVNNSEAYPFFHARKDQDLLYLVRML
jgi:hypothetical protein